MCIDFHFHTILADGRTFCGNISLQCSQDAQNGREPFNRTDHMIMFGIKRQPFRLDSLSAISNDENGDRRSLTCNDNALSSTIFDAEFRFAFRFEGMYRVRPIVVLNADDNVNRDDNLRRRKPSNVVDTSNGVDRMRQHYADDLMIPALSFSVITKI